MTLQQKIALHNELIKDGCKFAGEWVDLMADEFEEAMGVLK